MGYNYETPNLIPKVVSSQCQFKDPMGAAGWHISFDVLDRLMSGTPIGRIVGGEAMKFGWQRLNADYAKQFGIETSWNSLHKIVD